MNKCASANRMDFAWYSLSLVLTFATVRWVTENFKFHLRTKKVWVHHWILALGGMVALFGLGVDEPWVWGAITGVALEGLRRDQWSIVRKAK